MSAVISSLRDEHKTISRILFQLLPLAQRPCDSDEKKRLVVNQIKEKLMQLEALIGGPHHLVEELMMQKLADIPLSVDSQKLVANMLADHDLLEVFSELLMLRIEEYLVQDDKKAVLIRAVNQYVKHYIQHISREQSQLFKLCEDQLSSDDWSELSQVYPVQQDLIT